MSAAHALPARLGRLLLPLSRAYASVLFCQSPRVGAWFALMTWWSPRAALAGLVALIAAAVSARLLSLSLPGEPHLMNSLLCGLFIGAFHALDFVLLAWVVITALLATLLAHWLAALFWSWGKLPVMSLPFVIATWIVLLATRAAGPASLQSALPAAIPESLFSPWWDQFFSSLGWFLLIPYPLAGALLFAGLVVASRYLALLALTGYAAGHWTMQWFGQGEVAIVGFNFMLSAMALGGIFTVPGRASFIMALASGAMAAWFSVALDILLLPLHLPLLTLPFLLVVWLWLGGLGTRSARDPPHLTQEFAETPEAAYERLRLSQARGGETSDSLSLLPPFYGEWRVSQGFNGPHTHRAPWQHALDFVIVEQGRSHQGSGLSRNDYFCFGAPVLAPVSGQVAAARDDLPDVAPGEPDTANNWGNHLLLRVPTGCFVLLAHLKQGSLLVRNGDGVAAGQPVAACGSSGRSPEPHLHLQVQDDEQLGSPTRPFHLANLLVAGDGLMREFRLRHQPVQGEDVVAAARDERIAAALHLAPGRSLAYRLSGANGSELCHLRTQLTLLGQPRLIGDNGSSAAYEETPVVLGFYDRKGAADAMLDLWQLALGLTPLSAAAEHWGDRPSMHLLPLGSGRRLLAALLRPLGTGCDGRYRRRWDDAAQSWRQEGEFCLHPAPGIRWRATTAAWIDPSRGVRRLRLEMFGKLLEAELLDKPAAVIEAPGIMAAPALAAAQEDDR